MSLRKHSLAIESIEANDLELGSVGHEPQLNVIDGRRNRIQGALHLPTASSEEVVSIGGTITISF